MKTQTHKKIEYASSRKCGSRNTYMHTYKYCLYIVDSSVFGNSVEEFVICSSSFPDGSLPQVQISCGINELIDIQVARVAHYIDVPPRNNTPCNVSNIILWMADEYSYRRCKQDISLLGFVSPFVSICRNPSCLVTKGRQNGR